jgi:hypothetical protein
LIASNTLRSPNDVGGEALHCQSLDFGYGESKCRKCLQRKD